MSLYLGTQLLAGIATNTIYNAHDLFDNKWTDHLLNDESWLRADTFSWQDGTVYSDAYNHLVADYSEYSGVTGISDGSHIYEKDDSANIVDGETTYYAWTYNNTSVYTTTGNPTVGSYTVNPPGIITPDIEIIEVISGLQTETIGSYTITYYLATDGHKICLPDQETTAANIYTESGVAWYYILDKANQRFKLPRENPAREELIQVIRAKGNGMALGLTTNGTNVGTLSGSNSVGLYANATNPPSSLPSGTLADTTLASGRIAHGITTDSTKSGIISSMTDSNSVYKGKKYLYFYVGQFSQSATEQTAGLNSELFNGKVDLNLNNMNPSATAKETIVGWGIPDYSAGIDISNGNISSVYGWFYISGHSYSTTVTVSLNDSVVYTGANYGSERLSNTCILFVKPNDKISWAGWTSQVSMARIYPCIGVN